MPHAVQMNHLAAPSAFKTRLPWVVSNVYLQELPRREQRTQRLKINTLILNDLFILAL